MNTRDITFLFDDSDTPDARKRQIDGLRRMVLGLAQDVDLLKRALREAKVLEAPGYKKLRVERMVGDHSGAGAFPFRHHSYFPYLLEEEDFLRTQLGATDEELQAYREEVEFVSSLS